jgi:Uncharacterized conserved protein
MSLIATYLLPHPPLIFPEIGNGEEQEITSTIEAYKEIAEKIAETNPDTVIIVSPHVETSADTFLLPAESKISGDMREFGAPDIKLSLDVDYRFIHLLIKSCRHENFPATKFKNRFKLDHATMIPARFIEQTMEQSGIKYVTIGVTDLSLDKHRHFGELIAKTAEKLNRKIVLVASGDLSHRLKDDGPYGFNEKGPEFDKDIQDIVKKASFEKLFEMSVDYCQAAGECGHRPLCVMSGAIDSYAVKSQLLSYEAPFGVGYCVASFDIMKNPLVKLAQKTVEEYVRSGKVISSPKGNFPGITDKKAGVFVSIKKFGELRGCIGTIKPTAKNIAKEVIHNAISAATHDSRFEPISENELSQLSYSVDVLHPTESIRSISELNPKLYGVIVQLGDKQGLLLPRLEGINTAKKQVRIAMQKAGISQKQINNIKLSRFKVDRFY